jgi:hypothetical protein
MVRKEEKSMLVFEDITIAQQERYLELLRKVPEKASDYSFINLWGWATEYGLSWAWDNDLVWIRQAIPSPCLWAPVGAWGEIDWRAVLRRPEVRDLPFTRVPEKLIDLWNSTHPGLVQAQEAREHFDYLYSVPELVELKGNRFHKKKNLLNQFRKKYQHQYRPIEPGSIPEVLAMQDDWCAWQDCESTETLAAENRVIYRVLRSWEQLNGIMGAVIVIDGAIAAFTVAEALTGEMLIIHFEKGLPEFIGIYQAINQMFLDQAQGFSLVNREQDLNDEGLRKSKLSYNPVGYIRKYHARIT